MFTISKRFDFSAAHKLAGLPPDHPCSRRHGHNYSVEVELQGARIDGVGMVIDYRALDVFKHMIDLKFDHRDLNDFMAQPTAECLAEFLHGQASAMFNSSVVKVTAVRVRETDKTCAEFRPVILEVR